MLGIDMPSNLNTQVSKRQQNVAPQFTVGLVGRQ